MGDKMVQMPYLWTRTPKCHTSVYSDIAVRMLVTWTFEEIFLEVVKSGIEDEDDQMQTARALRVLRDHRREVLERSKAA